MPPSISTISVSSPESTSLRSARTFGKYAGDERLSTETGFDADDEQGVELTSISRYGSSGCPA